MARYTTLEPAPGIDTKPALQRAHGVGRLQVRQRSGAATQIGRLFQEGSAKIRFAGQDDAGLTATLINTAGGIAGGDSLEWDVELDADARCTVITQACEKVYRAEGEGARVCVGMKVGREARLDWLPQETILFDGARINRRFDVHLAQGARFLAVEAVLLGRQAMGEYRPNVHLRDRWRVWKGEDLIFADDVRLDDSMGPEGALLNGAGAYASVLYVGEDYVDRAPAVRDLITAAAAYVKGGASAFQGKLFCRLLAREGLSLRRVLIPILEALRDGERLPRLWTI